MEAGEQGHWWLRVEDNGPGLSGEVLEKVMRVNEEPIVGRLKLGGGLGAGLRLSQNLATTWGGQIKYESRVGGGSIFKVIVPSAAVLPSEANN